MIGIKFSTKDYDKGFNRIKKELALMDNSHVNIGVLSDAGDYPSAEGGVNLADVATFNEFGTSTIPERPFMRQTFDKNIKETQKFIDDLKTAIFVGRSTTPTALRKIGVFYTGKVKDTFTSGNFTPNAESTVAKIAKLADRGRKALKEAGRNKFLKKANKKTPLIDTGRLRNSISYEVKLK